MLPVLIILIGIILIILNVKAIKKEDKSFEKILNREEMNNNKDYDVEIISIRRDLAETVLDLQKEIEVLKKSLNYIKNNKEVDDNKYNIDDYEKENSEIILEEDIIENDVISEINFNNKKKLQNDKMESVKSLLQNGLRDEEICEKLSIGKGEVLLIKSLLRK
ncbi:hypothetical protein A500_05671 [Clostridium sartagoforme AAU1]|uniref:Uncharacterized protein n=1 Tax=Clostridium sartagoforme AAU1 TaxID=1202534 RepID=R9CD67_9CLOT|nr:hypothetical protein [Clostridium sartagoforme]EOR27237.1 hypothetical protein A500_05671 [Clostridium sartagoforme AAU1]